MINAGGKTTRFELRDPAGNGHVVYEIAVSTALLFHTFHDVTRPITVTGLSCQDRLEALQRVFEHELVHLVELLLWHGSSCRHPRFQAIAARFFGHRNHTHALVTPRERAAHQFGINPGDRVLFRWQGARVEGIVNRITQRATVLVQDPDGEPYSDGRRYKKFLVPLGFLERLRP